MTTDQYRQTATEAETQLAIVQALRYRGWLVLTTDRHRKGGGGGPDGISRGLPDLFVFDPNLWGDDGDQKGGWIGLEVKRPSGGRLSPAQEELVRMGAVWIVRSVEEAFRVLGRERP